MQRAMRIFYKTFRMWESIIYYRYLLCPNRFANINNIFNLRRINCDMIIDEKLRIKE